MSVAGSVLSSEIPDYNGISHPENVEYGGMPFLTAQSLTEASRETSSPKGMLLSNIIEFSRQSKLKHVGFDDMSVSEVYNQILLPMLQVEKKSFVDIITKHNSGPQQSHAARILIVYSWQMKFKDLITMLSQRYQHLSPRYSFWLDIFCTLPPNSTNNNSFNQYWSDALSTKIREVTCCVLILSPWERCSTLKHLQTIYCLYQAYCHRQEFEILVGDSEYKRMINIGMSDPDLVAKLWLIPTTINECQNTTPAYGINQIQKELIAAANWEKISGCISRLLKTWLTLQVQKERKILKELRPIQLKFDTGLAYFTDSPPLAAASLPSSFASSSTDDSTTSAMTPEQRGFGLCQAALQDSRCILGSEHVETLRMMSQVAQLCLRMRDWTQAGLLLQECYSKRCEACGNNHPETLQVMSALAEHFAKTGEFVQAEEMTNDCLLRQRQICGDHSVDTLQTLFRLASLCYDLGRYSQAEVMLLECLTGQETVVGPDCDAVLLIILKLACLYNVQRRFAQAEDTFLNYLSIARNKRHLTLDNIDLRSAVQNLANLYTVQWKYEQAAPLNKEILEFFKSKHGDNHTATIEAKVALAHVYLRMEKFGDAEGMYLDAVQRAILLFGRSHPTVRLYRGFYEKCVSDCTEWQKNNGPPSGADDDDDDDEDEDDGSNLDINGQPKKPKMLNKPFVPRRYRKKKVVALSTYANTEKRAAEKTTAGGGDQHQGQKNKESAVCIIS